MKNVLLIFTALTLSAGLWAKNKPVNVNIDATTNSAINTINPTEGKIQEDEILEGDKKVALILIKEKCLRMSESVAANVNITNNIKKAEKAFIERECTNACQTVNNATNTAEVETAKNRFYFFLDLWEVKIGILSKNNIIDVDLNSYKKDVQDYVYNYLYTFFLDEINIANVTPDIKAATIEAITEAYNDACISIKTAIDKTYYYTGSIVEIDKEISKLEYILYLNSYKIKVLENIIDLNEYKAVVLDKAHEIIISYEELSSIYPFFLERIYYIKSVFAQIEAYINNETNLNLKDIDDALSYGFFKDLITQDDELNNLMSPMIDSYNRADKLIDKINEIKVAQADKDAFIKEINDAKADCEKTFKNARTIDEAIYAFLILKKEIANIEYEIDEAVFNYYEIETTTDVNGNIDINITGAITKKCIEQINTDFADQNVTVIDLTQATSIDASTSITTGNPNTLIYLPEGTGVANTKNVIINETCENLVLTDNADFAPIAPFAATSVTMEKPAEDDGWYTMYLPYAFTPSEDVKVYTFEEAQGNTLVFAQQEGEVPAGTPMLCKRGEGASVMSFSAENVTITTEGVVGGQFIGTFTEIPAGAVTGSYILNVTGTTFGKATEKAYVPAFHCYYVADNSSSVDIKDEPIDSDARSNVLNIVIKDATGVKTLNMDLNEDVYSWQGFKGEGQINIKNRKKFVK